MNDQVKYPYRIDPFEPFILEYIPVFGTEEKINFFYKYKRKNENLYLGKINKDHLLLKSSDSLLRSIEPYFVKKQYLDTNIVTDLSKRLFPKVCWLTDSFFKKGFEHPVSVHYNPRLQRNVMHPGSIRNHIIQLFQDTPDVDCLYFNLGGVNFEFMSTMRIVEQDELIKLKDNIQIELVADHTSIVPHINLDYKSVVPNISRWQEFIYRRLTSATFTMSCNDNIEMFAPWITTEDKSYIDIKFSKSIYSLSKNTRDDIICKIAILSILGKSYQCRHFTLTHKLSFSTLE
jgi:hypothetical protein